MKKLFLLIIMLISASALKSMQPEMQMKSFMVKNALAIPALIQVFGSYRMYDQRGAEPIRQLLHGRTIQPNETAKIIYDRTGQAGFVRFSEHGDQFVVKATTKSDHMMQITFDPVEDRTYEIGLYLGVKEVN